MATKTQKEFKKQMKQFEKEGKIPEGYYRRRRGIQWTTSGASILLIVFLIWRAGILQMIFFMIMSTFFSSGAIPPHEALYDVNNQALYTYKNQVEETELFISDVYSNLYKHYMLSESIPLETFENQKEELTTQYDTIETDMDELKDIKESYQKSLEITTDMLDFAIKNYGNKISQQDKYFIEGLAKKSQALLAEREEFWY